MNESLNKNFYRCAVFLLWSFLVLNLNKFPVSATTLDYTQGGDNWTDTACVNGKSQSPINIDTSRLTKKEVSHVKREPSFVSFTETEYNGNYKLETEYEAAEIFYKGAQDEEEEWESVQFHYHAPSEHKINDEQFAAEMHLVFSSLNVIGKYQVLGVLFEYDEDAEDIELLEDIEISGFIANDDDTEEVSSINLEDFYELVDGSYLMQYQGSLTTPPWTEDVRWLVLRRQIKINAKQLAYFTRLYADNSSFAGGKGNNRNIQDLNDRKVFRLDDGGSFDKRWIILGVVAGVFAIVNLIAISAICFRQIKSQKGL